MGFSPQQVGAMSMWEFFSAREGYIRANDPDAEKGLSDKEADDLFAWVKG